jgi:hypothetical protein
MRNPSIMRESIKRRMMLNSSIMRERDGPRMMAGRQIAAGRTPYLKSSNQVRSSAGG